MLRWNRRPTLYLLVALSLGAGPITGTLRAQALQGDNADYLAEVRRRQEVAAQKTEADVRAALREAQRLALSDPAAAVERLRKALAQVENDTTLSERRRAALGRMLQDRIRVAQIPADREPADAARRRERAVRRAEDERRAGDAAPPGAPLDRGRGVPGGERPGNDPAPPSPDTPAMQAADRVRASVDRLSAEQRLQRERERNYATLSREVERSAMPPSGDVDFPKDWAARSQRRKKYVTTPLTAKEKAILRALATPVTIRFKDSPFESVIEALSTMTGQPIIVDRSALKEADIAYDTPVTAQVKGVSLRTLLHKILGEYGLAYVVKDEAIQITTAAKAKEMMVTRAYPISDLVAGLGPWGGTNGLFLPPGFQQAQVADNVKHIIDLIQTSVEPDSWRANGGGGTIVYHAPTMSLVIKQSAEVHAMLASGGLP